MNNLVFYGEKNAGLTALLAILAGGHKVGLVITDDPRLVDAAGWFGIPREPSAILTRDECGSELRRRDFSLLLCCHGRKIIRPHTLTALPCINLHPCLWKYPGANPIARLLADGERRASVGAHRMTEQVDAGEVLIENFIPITGRTEIEVYNELYAVYAKTALDALRMAGAPQRERSSHTTTPIEESN